MKRQDFSPESSRQLIVKLDRGPADLLLPGRWRENSLVWEVSHPCYNDGFKSRLAKSLSTTSAQRLKQNVLTAHDSSARGFFNTEVITGLGSSIKYMDI
jgi:hypothetical protein